MLDPTVTLYYIKLILNTVIIAQYECKNLINHKNVLLAMVRYRLYRLCELKIFLVYLLTLNKCKQFRFVADAITLVVIVVCLNI